jgi:hypothetical protein
MYFFPEAAARAVLRSGIRAALGMILIEFGSPYATDAADYLSKGLATRDRLKDEPLLSFCLAPHAPFTVSDASFRRIAVYSDELDLPVHVHLHETADEIRESLVAHGKRPIRRLQEAGLLAPTLIAVACRAPARRGNRAAGGAWLPRSALPFVQPEARERGCSCRAARRSRRQRWPGDRRCGKQQPARSLRRDAARRPARQGHRRRRYGAARTRRPGDGDPCTARARSAWKT